MNVQDRFYEPLIIRLMSPMLTKCVANIVLARDMVHANVSLSNLVPNIVVAQDVVAFIQPCIRNQNALDLRLVVAKDVTGFKDWDTQVSKCVP